MKRKKQTNSQKYMPIIISGIIAVVLIAASYYLQFGTAFSADARMRRRSNKVCQSLSRQLQRSYNSQCGDKKYNQTVDLNKDGIVSALDFSLLSAHITDEAWCSNMQNLENVDACDPQIQDLPQACRYLFIDLQISMNTSCGQENFSQVGDLNDDGLVTALDFSTLASHIQEADWCQQMLESSVDACSSQ